MKIILSSPLAADSPAEEFDVHQVKVALNRLGYYEPHKKDGITGTTDAALFTALKAFQSDHGLQATGAANPGDETVATLNSETTKQTQGQYIWRSVGDDKVRDSHAALDGTVRSWQDSPAPGEEINCRCWAEPTSKKAPIPPRKPNCNEKRYNRDQARNELQALNDKKEEIFKELEVLKEKKDEILRKIYEVTGSLWIFQLINIPLGEIGIVVEFIQRWLGYQVQDITVDKLSELVGEFMRIAREIYKKLDEFRAVIEAIKKAEENLLKAQGELDECLEKIPNG